MTQEIEQIKFRIFQTFNEEWSCERLFLWKDLSLKQKIRYFTKNEVWLRCDRIHHGDFGGYYRTSPSKEELMNWLFRYISNLEREQKRKQFVPVFEYVTVKDIKEFQALKKKAKENDS